MGTSAALAAGLGVGALFAAPIIGVFAGISLHQKAQAKKEKEDESNRSGKPIDFKITEDLQPSGALLSREGEARMARSYARNQAKRGSRDLPRGVNRKFDEPELPASFRINFDKGLAGRFWQEAMPVGVAILSYGAACAYKSKVVTLILSRSMPMSNHRQPNTLVFGVDKPSPKLGPVWLVEVGVGHDPHVDEVPVVQQTSDTTDILDAPIGLFDMERHPEATL